MESIKIIDRTEFSPIITDRYFSGLLWLLFGGVSGASLPTATLLANCSAALRSRPDVIDKTKRFLSQIDGQKAEHFESLMTKERAARYLTEITLGDSLLITAENAEEIYEKVEAIAAEKVAREKDEYYGEIISEQQNNLTELNKDLSKAQTSINTLQDDIAMKDAQIELHATTVDDLSQRLSQSERQRIEDEGAIRDLEGRVAELSASASRSEKESLRAKRTAIVVALRMAKRAFWVSRIMILVLFSAGAFALGYLDKFFIPIMPAEYQGYGNLVLIGIQTLVGVLGFGGFTDKVFGKIVRSISRSFYNKQLQLSGYSNCGPEFEVDFAEFEVKEVTKMPL